MSELFEHPRETWGAKECQRRAAKVNRDGLGTVGGPAGLINCDSATHPSYGQTKLYNGGCVREGVWYRGEAVPLPAIDDGYEFHAVTAWGTIIRKKRLI